MVLAALGSTCPGRTLPVFHMKIYEGSLKFHLVAEGKAEVVNRPELVAAYMRDAYEQNPLNESFWVITLNRKNYPTGRTMISLGTLTSSLAHPREVFRAAVMASAAAIIVTHNHPSGDPAPSAADVQVTRLWEASRNRVYGTVGLWELGLGGGSPVERKQWSGGLDTSHNFALRDGGG